MRMRICFLPKRREKSEEMVRPMAAAAAEVAEGEGGERGPAPGTAGGGRAAPIYMGRAAAAARCPEPRRSLARSVPRHARHGRPGSNADKITSRSPHPRPPPCPNAQRRRGLRFPAGAAAAPRFAPLSAPPLVRAGGCRRRASLPPRRCFRLPAERGMLGNVVRGAHRGPGLALCVATARPAGPGARPRGASSVAGAASRAKGVWRA